MIDRELIKPGTGWEGASGEVRYVIIRHKLGRGYGITWDSVPLNGDYWRGRVEREHETRPNGYMTMRAFQKWALAASQPHVSKGEGND